MKYRISQRWKCELLYLLYDATILNIFFLLNTLCTSSLKMQPSMKASDVYILHRIKIFQYRQECYIGNPCNPKMEQRNPRNLCAVVLVYWLRDINFFIFNPSPVTTGIWRNSVCPVFLLCFSIYGVPAELITSSNNILPGTRMWLPLRVGL